MTISVRFFDERPTGATGSAEELTESVAAQRPATTCALRVYTPLGWRLLDSSIDPETEAQRIVAQVAHADPVPPILLMGTGSGFVLRALCRIGATNIVAVSGSYTAAKLAYEELQTVADANQRIQIIAIHEEIDRVWTDHIRPFLDRFPTAQVVLHPAECAAYVHLLGVLCLKITAYRAEKIQRARSTHILWFGNGGLFEKEVIAALKQRGCTITVQDPLSGRRVTAAQCWELLTQHQPHSVLSTNNAGSDAFGLFPQACEESGTLWATWLLDDPRFLVQPAERLCGKKRIAFCWDDNGIDAWQQLGFSQAHVLPLATDPSAFTRGSDDIDPSLTGRLVFVGSARFNAAQGYFARLDQHPDVPAVVEACAEQVWKTRSPPDRAALQNALAQLGLHHKFDEELKRRLPAYVVHELSRRYRIRILSAVADLNPIIYGHGWENLLPATVELRGVADYDRDLPRIYRSDAIHLSLTNLQMRSYPNQRPFDVGACGRIVLQDRLPGWTKLFGDGFESLLFSDANELREKFHALKKNPDLRHDLGQKLYQQVIAQHTVDHRVETMLSVIQGTKI